MVRTVSSFGGDMHYPEVCNCWSNEKSQQRGSLPKIAALSCTMPIRRETPRQSYKRTALLQLEKYKIALGSVRLNTCTLALMVLALEAQRKKRRRQMFDLLHLVCLASGLLDVNAQLASLPRQQSTNCGPYKSVDNFDATTFYQQFRLSKEHFWMFMQALRWTDAGGAPLTFRFG
eukprot:1225754-Rhodomonas_salina.1